MLRPGFSAAGVGATHTAWPGRKTRRQSVERVRFDDEAMGTSPHGATTSRSSEAAEALHDQLQASLAALVTSDDWRQALEVAARFHNYSFSNSQLIWAQAQQRGFSPSRVTGYRTWRSLGRQVRKGEKGLAILAPIIRKVEVEDPGKTEKEAERRVVGFRPVHVFDISQTDGPPLPDTSPVLLEGDLPDTWEVLAGLIGDAGYSLHLEDGGRLGTANGLTDMVAKEVLVKESLSGAQRFKTAVHELAHIRLHEPSAGGRPDCRGTVEVEAESVAYMVCASLGLDTSDYSLPYVASWSGGDLDTVAATANRVIGCAHNVIEHLEADRRLEPASLERQSVEHVGVSDRQVWEAAVEPDKPAHRMAELSEILAATVDFYQEHLMRPASARARDYLTDRGFTSDTAEEWQLGYAPPSWNALTQHLQTEGFDQELLIAAGVVGEADSGRCYDLMRGRIIFPVLDESGSVRGLAGRQIVGDGPKYLNGPETALYAKRELLYGLHQANEQIRSRGQAVVVEGYTDVIAAHQAGYRNVVGTSGTALTEHHLNILAKDAGSVVLAFDGDSAGLNAIDRSSEMLLNSEADIRVAALPGGQDPASILAEGEASRLAGLVESATPLAVHLADRIIDKHNLEEVEGPYRALIEAVPITSLLDGASKRMLVEHLARRIDRQPEFVAEVLERHAPDSRSIGRQSLSRGLAR